MKAGRVIYDASKLDTCLADAKGPFCDSNNLGYQVPSCRVVFRGTVAPGGTCYAPYFLLLNGTDVLNECDGGYCTAGIQKCPGQCVAYAKVDDPCTPTDAHCGPDAYCDGGHCRAYLPVASPCGDATLQCDPRLACGSHDADGALTCETKKESGEACNFDVECHRFNCLAGMCRPGHEGETCGAFPKCDPGLKCGGRPARSRSAKGERAFPDRTPVATASCVRRPASTMQECRPASATCPASRRVARSASTIRAPTVSGAPATIHSRGPVNLRGRSATAASRDLSIVLLGPRVQRRQMSGAERARWSMRSRMGDDVRRRIRVQARQHLRQAGRGGRGVRLSTRLPARILLRRHVQGRQDPRYALR